MSADCAGERSARAVNSGWPTVLISPDGTQEMQFQDYVVPSSAAWRVVVRQLELWLEQMKNDSGGQ